MKVWLDDERDPRLWLPSMRWFRASDGGGLDDWVWARTAPEAIRLLEGGGITEVSLDHDLGDAQGVGEGYDVLLWIEERAAADDQYAPPIIHVHTSNVGARDRMEAAAVSIGRIVAGRPAPTAPAEPRGHGA